METKSTEGFLIKFCAFRRRSVSGGKERNVSKYEETVNSKNNINIDTTEINVTDGKNSFQNIKIIFKNKLQSGTYRILAELYDEYDNLKTLDYVNFIVE